MQQIDKQKFLFLYDNTFEVLKDKPREGLGYLLDQLSQDDKITDIRHAAYLLATTYHETAKTWQPIAEYGRGAGRKYGLPDHKTGKTYYGRGYVQLTWADNYITMGKVLGIDLLHDPDQAMVPAVAYAIMSQGMRKGFFTGVSLSKYINTEKCDYVNARRIINGTDCAEKIAGYADKFELMLHQSLEVQA